MRIKLKRPCNCPVIGMGMWTKDLHSTLISYADFVRAMPRDPKAPLTMLYEGSTLDVRLKPGPRNATPPSAEH